MNIYIPLLWGEGNVKDSQSMLEFLESNKYNNECYSIKKCPKTSHGNQWLYGHLL